MVQPQKKSAFRVLDPSFMLGAACTAAFYWVVFQPSMHGTVLYRYTTEHAVEYIVVALFMWGLVDLALKLLSFPEEFLALRKDWLPPFQSREPVSHALTLLEEIHARPRWQRNSRVGKRLAQALEYVVQKGSAEEYREHLHYLANQDEDQTHASFTLIRFVAGVTPILGFLGTVVHFGSALSGISLEGISDRLPTVVAEMGSAFNTTTVALAAAMTMMFSLFLCERIEGSLLRAIDRLAERDLLNRFEVKDANILPFLSIVQSANDEALKVIATTLHRQVETWSQSLDTLFQRFDARQQQEFKGWQGALETLQKRNEAYDAAREERLRQLLALVESRQEKHLERIQSTMDKALAIRDDFSGVAETLRTIARGEGKLAELQGVLADNLRVLRETQQIDDALHGLTAAIHLLTARHNLGERKAA